MTATLLDEPSYRSADEFAPENGDTETLLLCAVLFAGPVTAADVVDLLETTDFH